MEAGTRREEAAGEETRLNMIRDSTLFIILGSIGLFALIACAIFRAPRRYRWHNWGTMRETMDNRIGRFGESYGQDSADPEPSARVGRNAPCPCGSGKKYKRCCGRKV